MDRRRFLQTSVGLAGLSLPDFLRLRSAHGRDANRSDRASGTVGSGRAKRCIVLFCWGGVSQLDTWDPKPDASDKFRGEFRPISTATPGIQVSEHLPRLARHTGKLAIVRSVHHGNSGHGKAMYWNMTGHPPPQPSVAANLPPASSDWPSLGAVVSKFRRAPKGLPPAVRLPYPLVDNGTLQAGEYGGWLGMEYDPIVVSTKSGRPFGGVSRGLGASSIDPTVTTEAGRLRRRLALLENLESPIHAGRATNQLDYFRGLAVDMLQDERVQETFNLEKEPRRVREAYGDHICGKSMLLARRLVSAGVPIATVVCSAGDLNGSKGDHWDTHGDNFNRLKNTMLPVFDRSASALLDDLSERGMLDETLVVFLTEFGRTPQINGGAGRDHFPNCYSVVFAGGGIRGGQIYGRSDRIAAKPVSGACGPADLHATIFEALGISHETEIHDRLGRPFPVADGKPLPLF